MEGLKRDPQAPAQAIARVCRSLEFGKGGGSFPLLLRTRVGMSPRSVPPCPLLQGSAGEGGQSWGEGKEEGEEEMFFFFNWKQ